MTQNDLNSSSSVHIPSREMGDSMWNSLNKIASDSIPHELIKHNYLYILIINCLLLSWNFVILIPRNSFLIAHFKPIMNIPEMQIINLLSSLTSRIKSIVQEPATFRFIVCILTVWTQNCLVLKLLAELCFIFDGKLTQWLFIDARVELPS